MTTIHELLNLPKSVRKGDFVQSLASGIAHPAETVKSYAVTPAILHTYRQAFSIVHSALETGRSQAAYLHGSFGSGKSHFMALLNLMLANDPLPWGRSELHPLKAEFEWVGHKKLLQLPMHFLSARSIDDKIFDTYVRWSEQEAPQAPVPALYRDQELFANASELRSEVGDEKFFAKLASVTPANPRWGALAGASGWDAARFEATLASRDERERGELFSALTKSWLPAFVREQGRFIELDRGLGVLAQHAADLGYDGIVFYLDELILWLASSASNLALIERETQKLVNLKEGEHDSRAIPIVSFIARQRDLAQLVGQRAQGNVRAALEDNLKHNQGRFETVTLADSNLPAIVEHRVLQPRDDAAREQLVDGFAHAWRRVDQARSTLVGSVGDEAAFRRVFPFSPALIEALVALSDCLQRERTAIRILMELLVDHLPQLELGPVVPVGDAFDVIAGGEDPFDQVMRQRFDRARHLYRESFLPLIQAENETGTAKECQRLRDDHPKKLGCSGCQSSNCRNDNRLAKTLLMAALVPEAAPFKGLTVRRLVHLNHGSIASPIPGAEVQLAAEKLRRWGAQIGPLRVGDQADPELNLHLEGIDLTPVIERARAFDTPGARKQKLRRLLFEALGLPPDATAVEHKVLYRGIRRKGTVRFGNVREMSDSQLRCPSGSEWYLVLDFPFDQAGFSPEHDLERIETFRTAIQGQEEATLVWLPTFFHHELEQTLGDLAAIDHVLEGQQAEYLGHLRPEDQVQARGDLRSLRDQKRDQIGRALAAAYGLTSASGQSGLDLSRTVEEHVISLFPGLRVGPLLAGSLKDGLQQVVERLFEFRFPHHPHFAFIVTTGKLDRVRGLVERLLESAERRLPVTVTDRKDLQGLSDPLGLTRTTESATVLEERTLGELEQRRAQAGLEPPTVLDIRGYADPNGHLGLTPELQDLLVWIYTQWSGRSLVQAGREVTLKRLGQLPEDAELVRPDLPAEEEWQKALGLAGDLFGITFAKRHLSARNLSDFAAKLGTVASDHRSAAEQLPAKLAHLAGLWAPGRPSPRQITADSAASLIRLLAESEQAERIRRLARYAPETSATAVSKSLASGAQVLAALRSQSRWLNFRSVKGLLNDPSRQQRASQVLEDLAEALSLDELNRPLEQILADLTRRAAEIIPTATTEAPADSLVAPPEIGTQERWQPLHSERISISDPSSLASELQALGRRLQQAIEEAGAGGEIEVSGSLELRRRTKGAE